MKLNQGRKERLLAVLQQGNAAGKREFWTARLETMSAAAQDIIIGLFEMLPAEIGWFSDVQVQKEEAMAKRDTAFWDTIVAEEEKRMPTIASSIQNI